MGRQAEADALEQTAKATAARSKQKAAESIRLEQERTQALRDAGAQLLRWMHQFQSSPQLLYPGSSEGIKTLILRSGNTQRVYAVAGRKIFLHIPQSTLQTNGDTMVITTM